MAAKRAPSKAAKPDADSLLNTVARTVGSTLGTIVAKTEQAIENRGEALEALKDSVSEKAAEVQQAVSRRTSAIRRSGAPRNRAQTARKTAARKKRVLSKAASAPRASARRKKVSATRANRAR